MSELFGGLSDSLGSFVRSWLLPSLVGVGLWAFLIFPIVDESEPFRSIDALSAAERLGIVSFATLVVAYIIAAVATPVYQVIEGYYCWPKPLRASRVMHHQEERAKARRSVSDPQDRVQLQHTRLKLDRYPRNRDNVMPSRLGNVLRAAETYGNDQYGIDTVILWQPLVSACDETTRSAIDQTRGVMDFFVGMIMLGPLFAVTSAIAALIAREPAALHGAWSLLIVYPAYLGAVDAALPYGRALRSVSHTARFALADHLRLKVPADALEERALWTAVKNYVAWGPEPSEAPKWITIITASRKAYDEEHQTR